MKSTAVPVRGDAAQRAEQAVDLGAGQGGGGLVEHEQREAAVLAGAVEGAGDTDGGALGLGQLGDRARRVDVVAEGGEGGAVVARGRRCGAAATSARSRRLIRKLSDTVIDSTRPRSWCTKRSPAAAAAGAEPSSNGTSATSATAPRSGSW